MSDKHTVIWVNGQDRIVDDGASYFKQFRHPVNGWVDEEGALDEPWILALIEDYHTLKPKMVDLQGRPLIQVDITDREGR